MSRNKHANYRDKRECSYFYSGDSCSDNVAAGRVTVGPAQNIGGWYYRMKDCVSSTLGALGMECLWSGSTFAGWQLASGTTPYSEVLEYYGWKSGTPF